jgi:hypothetical protein
MAEGDTVFATGIRLHEALAGQVLTRTDFRVPRFATWIWPVGWSARSCREANTSSFEQTVRSPSTLTSA